MAVVACNLKGQEKMPSIEIPLKDMNKELQLSAPPEISTFKIGDNLGLVLVNYSDNPILLPQDYGVHIYQFVDEKWELIENRIDYPSGGKAVYPRDNQPVREVLLVVHPFIFSDQPIKVRVVVVGNYYLEEKKETGQPVGAYTDITLEPK